MVCTCPVPGAGGVAQPAHPTPAGALVGASPPHFANGGAHRPGEG